ncbi:MAG: type II 3-dehydroquinate dehydratase [Peptococcia bacterium]
MFKVYVIHGPNLNLLGSREPAVYGELTLKELNNQLISYGEKLGLKVETFQSNHEGVLVEKIQEVASYDYLIINAAAYTHTSIAIRDALLATGTPTIEVHISNLYQREDFRQCSLLADIVQGQIMGLGVLGYRLALDAAIHFLQGGTTIA